MILSVDLWKFARNSLTFEQAVGVGTCLLGVWLYNQKETKATVWIYRVMACSWKAMAGFIKGPQKNPPCEAPDASVTRSSSGTSGLGQGIKI